MIQLTAIQEIYNHCSSGQKPHTCLAMAHRSHPYLNLTMNPPPCGADIAPDSGDWHGRRTPRPALMQPNQNLESYTNKPKSGHPTSGIRFVYAWKSYSRLHGETPYNKCDVELMIVCTLAGGVSGMATWVKRRELFHVARVRSCSWSKSVHVRCTLSCHLPCNKFVRTQHNGASDFSLLRQLEKTQCLR